MQTFGRLSFSGTSKVVSRKTYYEVTCFCGWKGWKRKDHLISGRTQSCGCLHKEESVKRFTKHGFSANGKTRTEYNIRRSMIARCYKKSHDQYKDYGGRGITVCARWLESFENFYADMGPRPDGLTLDRINNDGNYEPGNCRWATRKEQRANCRQFTPFKKKPTTRSSSAQTTS